MQCRRKKSSFACMWCANHKTQNGHLTSSTHFKCFMCQKCVNLVSCTTWLSRYKTMFHESNAATISSSFKHLENTSDVAWRARKWCLCPAFNRKTTADFNISTFKVLWPKPNLTAAVSRPLPRGYFWYDSKGHLAVDLPSTHVNGDGPVHLMHAVWPCKVVFICVFNFRPGCSSHTSSAAVAVSYPRTETSDRVL